VNACLEEAAAHCEANGRRMAAVKAGTARGSAEERRSAVELYHSIATKDPFRRADGFF
jgi:hypothetical protein